jgi:hypothetical protein
MAQLSSRVTISFAAFGASNSTPTDQVERAAASANKASAGSNTIEWPSTPKINQSIEVNYSTWELQHTNYQPSAFGNRATPVITISGPWFSRNATEAKSTLDAIQLLRAATSMYYGRNDPNKGTPPPVGRLNAHGLYNGTPVVVKSFNYDFPNDVDYITTSAFGGQQAVPVLFEMSVSLIVQITPLEAVKEYSLSKFVNGDLLGNGYI